VVQGSDLTEQDIKSLRNVGLIGQGLVRELFGEGNSVGKHVLVGRIPVQIVGALSERGMSGGAHRLDNRLVMPITTVMRKVLNESQYISAFRIRFLDQANLEQRQEEIRLFLREIMKTPYDEPDQFRIISPTVIIEFLVALTGSLVVFIGIAGIICLIVAGFVLANLFLLSVQERSKEIGIRRAVGARRRDILVQFLEEALIVTTSGGGIGVVLALGGARLLTAVGDFPIHFSWRAFAVGMVLAWIIGIVFGLQPARRAALIEPIEAIRA
jgi:putative ABC transport system permease protein